MPGPSTSPRRVRFGTFEVDVRAGELRKSGVRVSIQEQPLRILARLLECPGDVVTREELRQGLWPADTFVDFEHGLNAAIKRLRDALGDSAENPTFIETLPRRGYRFIAPVGLSDDDLPAGPVSQPAGASGRSAREAGPRGLRLAILGGAALALAVVSGAIWIGYSSRGSLPAPARVSTMRISPVGELQGGPGSSVAISPNAQLLVYVAWRDGLDQLFLRSLATGETIPLRGTERARAPFFSPDSRWIGFFADGHLKKLRADGGEVQGVCAITGTPAGASWATDDAIVFAEFGTGLRTVVAAGGEPHQLTVLDTAAGEVDHRWPEIIGGGDRVLFTVWTGSVNGARIAVTSVTGRKHSVLFPGTHPRTVGRERVLFLRGDGLWMAALDADGSTLSGAPVRLLDGIRPRSGGATDYSVARDGAVAYVPSVQAATNTLEWINNEGRALIAGDKWHMLPRISPDGSKLAVNTQAEDGTYEVWIYDLTTGSRTRLPIPGSAVNPVWTPDGRRIAFTSMRNGPSQIYWISADGGSDLELLVESGNGIYPTSWSRDWVLAYVEEGTSTGADLWMKPRDGAPRPFLATSHHEYSAAFSPDGRWVAYVSNRTGLPKVYVLPRDGDGQPVLVSNGGGDEPVWSRSGAALHYRSLSAPFLFKVQVMRAPKLTFSAPVLLSSAESVAARTLSAVGANYDVTLDERLVVVRQDRSRPREIVVNLEFLADVDRRRPHD